MVKLIRAMVSLLVTILESGYAVPFKLTTASAVPTGAHKMGTQSLSPDVIVVEISSLVEGLKVIHFCGYWTPS